MNVQDAVIHVTQMLKAAQLCRTLFYLSTSKLVN